MKKVAMLPKTGGIYRIIYLRNGDEYIGSAMNLYRRWELHKSQLRMGRHHSKYMQRVFDKYGLDAFEFEIIEHLPIPPGWTNLQAKDRLIPIEQEWLDERQPAMNGSKVAGSLLGYKHSEETRRKISESQKGRKHTPETRAKMSESAKGHKRTLGRKLTEEHKRAISNGQQNRPPVSEETRAKMRESAKKRWDNPEEREKIAAQHRGTTASQETKDKLSASHKGRVVTAETREKIRATNTGHEVSAETRAKIGAANKAIKEFKRWLLLACV